MDVLQLPGHVLPSVMLYGPHGPGLVCRSETSAATASFHPRHALPSSRLLGAVASAWRENPRSSHERTRVQFPYSGTSRQKKFEHCATCKSEQIIVLL